MVADSPPPEEPAEQEAPAPAVATGGAAGGGGAGVKIEKQHVCPGWKEFLRYEHFRKQVENWDAKNTHDETSKYYEVLESLKKNDKIDGLKKYVAEVVCEQMKDEKNPTVTKLLDILDSRFLRTKFECVSDVSEELYAVKDSNVTDSAKFFEKIKTLAGQFKDEKIQDNINFMLLVMMLKKGKSSGVLTEWRVRKR